MSRDIAPFGLRMPLDLRAGLEASATANGRSLNAEIVYRLRGGNAPAVSAPTKSSCNPMLWEPVNRLEALLEVVCDRLLDISFLEDKDDREKTNTACLFAQIASEIAADLAEHVGVR